MNTSRLFPVNYVHKTRDSMHNITSEVLCFIKKKKCWYKDMGLITKIMNLLKPQARIKISKQRNFTLFIRFFSCKTIRVKKLKAKY